MKKLFPRNKKEAVIAYLLQNPNEEAKVNEIAKRLKINKAIVSVALRESEKEGLIKDRRIVLDNPITKALKILQTTEKFVESDILNLLKSNSIAAGIYGSSAKGIDVEASDIDIWIKPNKDLDKFDAIKLARKLTELLGKQVQVIVLDKKRLESLRKESPNFYYSLVFGSLILFGDGIN